jgi:hypothetical protein
LQTTKIRPPIRGKRRRRRQMTRRRRRKRLQGRILKMF